MGDDLSRGEEPTRVAQGTQLQGSNLREIVPCGRSYICSKAIAISTILTSLANQPSLASAAESRLTIGAIWAYRSLVRFWKAARAWARAPEARSGHSSNPSNLSAERWPCSLPRYPSRPRSRLAERSTQSPNAAMDSTGAACATARSSRKACASRKNGSRFLSFSSPEIAGSAQHWPPLERSDHRSDRAPVAERRTRRGKLFHEVLV